MSRRRFVIAVLVAISSPWVAYSLMMPRPIRAEDASRTEVIPMVPPPPQEVLVPKC